MAEGFEVIDEEDVILKPTENFTGMNAVKEEQKKYQQSFAEVENDLEVVQNSSDLREVLDHLYKEGNILELTELTSMEINRIGILFTYATDFGFRELRTLILNNLQLRVSKSRKGREESVKIANAQLSQAVEFMQKQFDMDKRSKKG